MDVRILLDSPTQHGTDAILSFFVVLPGGTMPLDLLTVIFVSSPNVDLTDVQRENLIELSINNATTQVKCPNIIICTFHVLFSLNFHSFINNNCMNEVEHDMKNYPAEVCCYQPKPKPEVDNDKL
jgi:hypothetical protein